MDHIGNLIIRDLRDFLNKSSKGNPNYIGEQAILHDRIPHIYTKYLISIST